jgi:hypothetical protein
MSDKELNEIINKTEDDYEAWMREEENKHLEELLGENTMLIDMGTGEAIEVQWGRVREYKKATWCGDERMTKRAGLRYRKLQGKNKGKIKS